MAKEGAASLLLQQEDCTVLQTRLCWQPLRPQPCIGGAS